MQILVAGGTGVVGRRAVTRLVRAGHRVTAAVRSQAGAELARSLGATPVTVDLFDAEAVRGVAQGHDAVVNLATSIPPLRRSASAKAWAANDALRREGSRNLAQAAIEVGAAVFVQESIAFAHPDGGDTWIEEGSELADTPYTPALRAAESHAAQVSDAGGRGVVLRFGMFHAADAGHTRAYVAGARHGRLLLPGDPGAYLPIVHADDAADAVVAALDAPAGTYEVVTDECPTRQDLADAASAALGGRRVRPLWRPVAAAVRERSANLAWSQRVGNRRFTEATRWRPAYPDARAVWAAVVEGPRPAEPVPGVWARAALVVLAVSGLVTGLWAGLAPESFYSAFPGGGRQWIAPDGPFNEHLVRDVGWLQVALGVVAIAALATARRSWARLAGVAWLIFAVPHLIYHLTHLDVLPASDQVAVSVSLGGQVLAGVLAAVAIGGRPRRSAGSAASLGRD